MKSQGIPGDALVIVTDKDFIPPSSFDLLTIKQREKKRLNISTSHLPPTHLLDHTLLHKQGEHLQSILSFILSPTVTSEPLKGTEDLPLLPLST